MSLLRQIIPSTKKKKNRGPVDMTLSIVRSAVAAPSVFEKKKVRNDENGAVLSQRCLPECHGHFPFLWDDTGKWGEEEEDSHLYT